VRQGGIEFATVGPIFVKYAQKWSAISVGSGISLSSTLNVVGKLLLLFLSLRAAVCKYREFAVKTDISEFFIFSQKKPFGETFSKITIKVSKEFFFSRKPAKSEMLPQAI